KSASQQPRAEFRGPQRDLEQREQQLARQQQELAGLRQELAEIRRQLYDRYRKRRDRLAGLHEAVDRAARKVQERKLHVDAETEQSVARVRELDVRHADLEARQAQLTQGVQLLDERTRLLRICELGL